MPEKIESYEMVVTESFPEQLESGKFYVSYKYALTAHLCPCGCGTEVPIPFIVGNQPDGGRRWGFTIEDGKPSLHPSLLMRGGCKSHYFLQGGRVQWC